MMKKLFLLSVLFFCVAGMLRAVPAPNRPVKMKQADGTFITVYIRGDEGTKWLETMDGYSLLQKDGQCYYTVLDGNGRMVISEVKAHEKADRTRQEKQFLRTISKQLRFSAEQISEMRSRGPVSSVNLDTGKKNNSVAKAFAARKSLTDTVVRRAPVILVNFADLAIQTSREQYDSLIGFENYTAHGCTGSFRDYFLANSRGLFQFEADVIGPITLSREMSYYGGNDFYGQDQYPDRMVAEACRIAADSGVDFSLYDFDGNDTVDGIHIIFPGKGEEATGETDAIWSHKWNVQEDLVLNGKKIDVYSCSGEFSVEGDWAYIGTLVHELSHVFGLPDLYDTDYGTNGQAVHPGEFEVMAQGSYNGGGKTPPLHNAWSRAQMGWLDMVELEDTCVIELWDAEKAKQAFMYRAPIWGEYFVLDYRGEESKWDAELPGHGMLIYAVNEAVRGWKNNRINSISTNRGFYIKQANGGEASNSRMGKGTPFPGTSNNTSFNDTTAPASLVTTRSIPAEKPIYGIAEMEEGGITFFFMGEADSVRDNLGRIRHKDGTYPEPPVVANQGTEEAGTGLVLYPNPAADRFAVRSAEPMEWLRIYTVYGGEERYLDLAGRTEAEVHISGLAPGMYIVEVKTAKDTQKIKMLKSR